MKTGRLGKQPASALRRHRAAPEVTVRLVGIKGLGIILAFVSIFTQSCELTVP
jgi:hypothetical protein